MFEVLSSFTLYFFLYIACALLCRLLQFMILRFFEVHLEILNIVLFVSWFESIVNFLMVPEEDAGILENQALGEPQASRFTWTIENFSRLNVKKLYSDVFVVGSYKW